MARFSGFLLRVSGSSDHVNLNFDLGSSLLSISRFRIAHLLGKGYPDDREQIAASRAGLLSHDSIPCKPREETHCARSYGIGTALESGPACVTQRGERLSRSLEPALVRFFGWAQRLDRPQSFPRRADWLVLCIINASMFCRSLFPDAPILACPSVVRLKSRGLSARETKKKNIATGRRPCTGGSGACAIGLSTVGSLKCQACGQDRARRRTVSQANRCFGNGVDLSRFPEPLALAFTPAGAASFQLACQLRASW